MAKARYIGSFSVYMPKIGKTLNQGDIIENGKIADWEIEERADLEKVIEEEPKVIIKEKNPIISESIISESTISESIISESIKDMKKGGK